MTSKHFKTMTVPFADPGEFDFSDAVEAYGDWTEIDTPCDKSPSGQCEFNAVRDPEHCIHCGKRV